MSEDSAGASPFHSISTAAELRQRLSERSAPEREPRLTPDGFEARTVEHRLDQLRESRIGELQSRLATMREQAERDHTFARLPGQSKAMFNQAREIGD